MNINNLKLKLRKPLLIISASFILLSIFSINIIAVAETSYVPLAPLPQTTVADGSTDLNNYLAGGFKLGIALAGVLAFLMIVIGGFQYLSTDAMTGKEEGKERIERAVGGLVLALASYIILYTINPNLVELDLEFGRQLTQAPEVNRPPSPNEQQLQDFRDAQEARAARAGAAADEQERIAREMLYEADNNFALSDEEVAILESKAQDLMGRASLSRTQNTIATAGNLGAEAASRGAPAEALPQLSAIRNAINTGVQNLQTVDPTKINELLRTGSLRHSILAESIGEKTVTQNSGGSSTSALAISMLNQIDRQTTDAVARLGNSDVEGNLVTTEITEITDRAKQAQDKIIAACVAKNLPCKNYPNI